MNINMFLSSNICCIDILYLVVDDDWFLMTRQDVIAQIYYARKLAEKLYPVARMVDLHGGHLVSRERTEEV